ncbi:putative ORFan [Tupanvirus deep ocean]|uniref:ORFan n=2 Tax=Tupanvirus TaxID=2094720 RepID=A0AC62A7B4_9VIRU|nr:putative ORFan [Tupanvirus deep ocean]QKU33518.1 putative ORFan [Tupanvirus deep ocean]
MSSKTAKKPEKRSSAKKPPVKKTTVKKVVEKKITLKDFGLVPTKVAKKNDSEKMTEFKIFVNQYVDSYLNDDLDKDEKDRMKKIFDALISHKERLEKQYPAKTDSDSESDQENEENEENSDSDSESD